MIEYPLERLTKFILKLAIKNQQLQGIFMTKKLIKILIITLGAASCYLAPFSFAGNEKSAPQAQIDQNSSAPSSQYQKVIEEFKNYARTIKPEIKKEISNYRAKIKELNEQRKQTYKELTQEAQSFLAKEKEFKKKLSWKEKKDFAKDARKATEHEAQ